MQASDYELNTDGTLSRGWGGARRGAGAKPAGYEKPQEDKDFDKARARHEAAKADLAELRLKVETGQYVSRESVRQAVATVMAGFVQTMRSVSDNLERQGVAPEVCIKVDAIINEALRDVGGEMEMLGGE